MRTAHIAAMGLLLGGHAYDVAPERLYPALWACLATGAALMVSETGFATLWFHQLRGLATMSKLLLIAAVPLFWDHRLAVLMVVVVIASVGSHMSARFRYYSVLLHKVIRGSFGPAEPGKPRNGGFPTDNRTENTNHLKHGSRKISDLAVR